MIRRTEETAKTVLRFHDTNARVYIMYICIEYIIIRNKKVYRLCTYTRRLFRRRIRMYTRANYSSRTLIKRIMPIKCYDGY